MKLEIFVQYNLMNQLIKWKEGKAMAEQLVALQRNHFGDIINFQTSEGRIISYRKALQEVEEGNIDGVNIQEDHDGSTYLTPGMISSFNEYPLF